MGKDVIAEGVGSKTCPRDPSASPKGTPIEMRSLPPYNTRQYNSYLIVKPIEVKTSIAAPWYGHFGGGIQYKFPIDFKTLQEFKIIIKF